MARNILISRRDWVRSAGVTFSGGSWQLPLANLQDIRPQFVAQAADPEWTSTTFDVDLGAQRRVGLFHFENLLATSSGTIRLRAGTDNTFAATNYDSGWTTAWPQDKTPIGADNWGFLSITGIYESLEYVALGMPRIFVPPATIACRYIRVEVKDSTASEPLKIGVFGACEAWEAPINFKYDWQLTPTDESDVQRVPFGSTNITQRAKRRRMAFGFDEILRAEWLARQAALGMIKGISDPLVIVPFPDDTANLEKTAIYGLFSADPQFSNPYFQVYASTFTVEQLV